MNADIKAKLIHGAKMAGVGIFILVAWGFVVYPLIKWLFKLLKGMM